MENSVFGMMIWIKIYRDGRGETPLDSMEEWKLLGRALEKNGTRILIE